MRSGFSDRLILWNVSKWRTSVPGRLYKNARRPSWIANQRLRAAWTQRLFVLKECSLIFLAISVPASLPPESPDTGPDSTAFSSNFAFSHYGFYLLGRCLILLAWETIWIFLGFKCPSCSFYSAIAWKVRSHVRWFTFFRFMPTHATSNRLEKDFNTI